MFFSKEQLQETVPAAFRDKSQGAAVGASKHYQFMTTSEIIEGLATLGWGVTTGTQRNSKKSPETAKHLIRFRNNNVVLVKGDKIPEILFVNSHDRTSSLVFHIGVFRVVCENGLVIADRTFDHIRVRHMGTTFETVSRLITEITTKMPSILTTINKFESIALSDEQAYKFAMDAIAIRFPEYINPLTNEIMYGKIQENINVLNDILNPIREADKGNSLWITMNKVQEKLIGGGFTNIGGQTTKTVRPAREIKEIGRNLTINKGIWRLADTYAEVK